MSSLFKLSIQGVRSFDPERHETIQFGFPLTLICGQNGCGKTTIIECLKYATTGDLPPNSKGGAFVNDPSISSRSITTAQVKLAFLNANGKSMITTRTMQLSKRKNRNGTLTNTFKTLDGQLAIISKGNKSTMSTKNAELDTSIPRYLGTSKAVLDNVIFCHQDESLWPLSEASVLKKRFDEIFEASRFTKVLDNLRSIRKDMSGDIKLLDQTVQHLKIDKERARKIGQKMDDLKQKIGIFTDEIATLTLEIEKKEDEAQKLFLSNQDFQETLSRNEQLKLSRRSCLLQKDRLQNTIDVLSETDNELTQNLHNFESLLDEKNTELQKLVAEASALKDSIGELGSKKTSLVRMEGQFNFKAEQMQKNLELSNKLYLQVMDIRPDVNDSKIKSSQDLMKFKIFLEKSVSQLRHEYDTILSEAKTKEDGLSSAAKANENLIHRESQRLETYEQDMQSTLLNLSSTRNTLEEIEKSGNKIKILQSDIQSSENLLGLKRQEFNDKRLDTVINEHNTRLSLLELKLDEVYGKISKAQASSDSRIKIRVVKERLEKNEQKLAELLSEHRQVFKSFTGFELKTETCTDVVETEISKNQSELEKITNSINLSEKKLAAIEASKKANKENLDQIISKISVLRSVIFKVISEQEIEEYDKVLEDVEYNNNVTLEALNTFEVTRQFKIKALEIAEKDNNCVLCKRSFDDANGHRFLEVLKEDISRMDIKKLSEDAASSKKEYESVKSIGSEVIEYKSSLEQEKSLEEKVQLLSIQTSDIISDLESSKKKKEEISCKFNDLKSLRNTTSKIGHYNSEIISDKNDINVMSSDAKESTTDASLDELQNLYKEHSNEIKSLRERISTLSNEKFQLQNQISNLESDISSKKLSVSDIEKSLYGIQKHKDEIQLLEEKSSTLTKKILDSKNCLDELNSKKSDFDKTIESMRDDSNKLISKKKSVIDSRTDCLKEISGIYESVKSYEEIDLPEFNKLENSIKENEFSLKQNEQNRLVLDKKIEDIKKHINESSNFKTNIRNNLEYRGLCAEIASISSQIEDLNVPDAEKMRKVYQEKSQDLRDSLMRLNSEHAGKVGEVRQLKDQLESLKSDLETEYQNVGQRYREEWVKLQTNTLVSNDIDIYSKALDNAIMKYHSIKMSDINKILSDLWRETYKGTDIDTICIKSDVNVQAKGNRSYNYRVVMYKQDVELDMRGRCSAGQKVLTSILIRLALAECFGANCGMIALDEPTTNLDQENAESLAHALNRIIEYRRLQKNFQLIIITHDENFLSHINGGKFTDHFYRVQRDEMQNSTIRSLPISLMREG